MFKFSYKKNNFNELVSNLVLIKNNMYFAVIKLDTFEYSIKSLNDDSVALIDKGQSDSLTNAQREVRNQLTKLGANFNE